MIAGGWQWNGLFTTRTGRPLNVTIGSTDAALSGTGNQRPNVAGDWHLPSDRALAARIAQWFNPAAFVAPATGTFGNAGRDIIIAPFGARAAVRLESFVLRRTLTPSVTKCDYPLGFNEITVNNWDVTVGVTVPGARRYALTRKSLSCPPFSCAPKEGFTSSPGV